MSKTVYEPAAVKTNKQTKKIHILNSSPSLVLSLALTKLGESVLNSSSFGFVWSFVKQRTELIP